MQKIDSCAVARHALLGALFLWIFYIIYITYRML